MTFTIFPPGLSCIQVERGVGFQDFTHSQFYMFRGKIVKAHHSRCPALSNSENRHFMLYLSSSLFVSPTSHMKSKGAQKMNVSKRE